MNLKRNAIYGLILFLSIYKILLISFFDGYFSFDETIITNISQNPIAEIFKIIKHEPHPPGLYLLLKLFSYNRFYAQIGIVLLNSLLTGVGVYYATKNRLIKKFNLYWGLLILISSHVMLNTGMTIKQDAISIPLFLIAFFAMLHILSQPNKYKTPIQIQFTASTFLVFFGYIYYFFSLLLLVISNLIIKSKKVWPYWLMHLGVLYSLYELLIKYQIRNNQGRFTWVNFSENNLLSSIYSGFHGYALSQINSFLLAFLVFISIAYIYSFYKSKTYFEKSIHISILLLSLFFTFTKLYVRPRYIVVLSILISITFGWALHHIKWADKYKKGLVLFAFTIPSLLSHSLLYYHNQQYYIHLHQNLITLSRLGNNSEIVYTTNHPILAYVDTLRFPIPNKKLIPLNLNNTSASVGFTHINEAVLALEGQVLKYNQTTIADKLKSIKTKEVIHFQTNAMDNVYFDSKNDLEKTYKKNCLLRETAVVGNTMMFLFTNCFVKE